MIDTTIVHICFCYSAESITPSKASAKKVKWLKKKLGITYEKKVTVKEMLAYYGTDPPADDRIFPSMPQPQDGAHFAKVAAAMDHARTNLLPFIPHLDNCFAFKNVSEWTHLWDMDIDGQSVHGTTDIVIAPHDAVDEADGLSPEVLVCFKLKPPPAPGLAMDWNSYALQAKVELMAACCASKRALVCFVTDFISGALSLRIAELADQTFGIVQAQLTLTQMAQVVAAVLKPEFRTVAYRPEEQVVEMPGPLRDAARFKRRFEETYEALDNDEEEKLKDLMQDEELPAHFKKQAIRDYLASYGLHSNILDAELAAFRAKQRDGDKDDPWYSMHTCTPSGRKK